MVDVSPYRRAPAKAGRPPDINERLARWLEELRRIIQTLPRSIEGTGTPEGIVFARAGSRFFRTDGAPGTFLYVKTTAATLNTGWVAYG